MMIFEMSIVLFLVVMIYTLIVDLCYRLLEKNKRRFLINVLEASILLLVYNLLNNVFATIIGLFIMIMILDLKIIPALDKIYIKDLVSSILNSEVSIEEGVVDVNVQMKTGAKHIDKIILIKESK